MNRYVTTRNWLSILRDLPSPEGDFLTVASLAKLTGLKDSAVRQVCWRNQHVGLLRRVGPSLYANLLKSPKGEQLAVILFTPAYLSLDWALSYYGLTQQVTPTLTCVTTGRPRRVGTFLGEISYIHFAEQRFFGFEQVKTTSGAETILAYPEKALLDWIYYRRLKGKAIPWDEIDLSTLNLQRLWQFADHFPPGVRGTLEAVVDVTTSTVARLQCDKGMNKGRIFRGISPKTPRENQQRTNHTS